MKCRIASRRLGRGGTITTAAENDLLRFEEGHAPATSAAASFAWAAWFRSLAPKT